MKGKIKMITVYLMLFVYVAIFASLVYMYDFNQIIEYLVFMGVGAFTGVLATRSYYSK